MRFVSLIVLFVVAVAVTFVLHEGAHWAVGELLGYDMLLRANSATLARGLYRSEIDANVVTAAGPLFTMLQGVLAYAAVRAFSVRAAFPFLLSALLMRILAAAVSLKTPNDEMRLGLWLGLGEWTVFAGVIGALLVLTIAGALHLRLGWRAIAEGVALWLVFASAVILSERYLPVYNPYA